VQGEGAGFVVDFAAGEEEGGVGDDVAGARGEGDVDGGVEGVVVDLLAELGGEGEESWGRHWWGRRCADAEVEMQL